MSKLDAPDPDFGPPSPILDPASVRWVCGTVLAVAAMVLAGWVAWVNPVGLAAVGLVLINLALAVVAPIGGPKP